MTSVIIPAAGLASRMKPLSRGVSKAMIPVNGRPLIAYILEHLLKADPNREIVIVENELGDIREFVSRVYPNSRIKTVEQGEKLGPLHAIHVGWQNLEETLTPVTVWLGDTICLDEFPFYQDFLAVHPVPDPHRWCLVDIEGNLYDKPDEDVPTDKALVGVYNFIDRARLDKAMVAGMKKPTHKGEHQIAALLTEYMKKSPMQLIVAKEWYDCGELTTYYESKAKLLKRTARSFNKIDVNTFYNIISKTSTDLDKQRKIEEEKQWFLKLDPWQSQFIPRILPSVNGELVMSLEPGTALNEVMVYDNLRPDIWNDIIRKIFDVHHRVFKKPSNLEVNRMKEECFRSYVLKNVDRLDKMNETLLVSQREFVKVREFVEQTGFDLCKDPIPYWSAFMHGDSHLGNIIYDPHSGSIKFVDPRGSFGSLKGTEGDMRYDMAKLLQDFYCGYSMMMAGRYKVDQKGIEINWVPGTEKLSQTLEQLLEEQEYDVCQLKKLAIVLLVTAIPFHEDDTNRQIAFWKRSVQLIDSLNEDI
jgi:glucose-1-phosphate thymidylyltransferase